MTFTAWKGPSANAIAEATGNAWVSPANAQTDDDNSANGGGLKGGGDSDTHRWTGFGFTTSDIPEGATINGVEVRLDAQGQGTGLVLETQIFDATNGASSIKSESVSTSRGDIVEGGASDLWGNGSISDADIRASTFGVQLEVTNNNATMNLVVGVYFIEVRVDYSLEEGLHLASGSLESGAATVAGSAAITGRVASGSLKSGGAAISGEAMRTILATGVVQAQLASIVAQASREAKAQGALASGPATVAGEATAFAVHTASGALVSGPAAIEGEAERLRVLTASGNIVAGPAVLGGARLQEIAFVGSASAASNDGSDPVIDLSGLSLQEGDYVLVGGCSTDSGLSGNAAVLTAGFDEIVDIGADDFTVVYRKYMGSTPDTSISCQGSGSSNIGSAYVAQVWRGVDQTTMEDVTPTTAASGIDPPSIDPTTDNCGIAAFAFDAGAAITGGPAGYGNFETALGDGAFFDPVVAAASTILTSSAAEDPGAFSGGSGFANGAATIALRPATVPGPATAVRTTKADGDLVSQPASLIGAATIFVQGIAAGALKAGASVIDGAANVGRKAAGALVSGPAAVSGSSERINKATGALASGAASVQGLAVRTAKATGELVSGVARIVGRMVINIVRPSFGLTARMSDAPVALSAPMSDEVALSSKMSDEPVALSTTIAP